MEKYIKLITKHRKKLLPLLILINIIALIGVTKIDISGDFQVFVPTESVYKEN